MIVPAIGGVASSFGNFAGNVAANKAEGLAGAAAPAGLAEPATPAAGGEGGSGVEGIEGLGGSPGGGASGATGGGAPSFGNALTDAISSLEEGQQNAAAASQALATGKVSDPEAAVTTVEDAALEMQLASQIRAKATEAAQTIFQTQV